VSAAKGKGKMRVVVDGSNLATEGRSTPSLPQLRDAVSSFLVEYPGAEMLVVVDATFGHRIVAAEQVAFKELEATGDMVSPPAGSVGRGDAFILKIAERIGGVVLSNDSFQEFQSDHSWLFEEGRLIGGKPVPRVGWIFTARVPVKGTVRTAAVKKLAIVLPDGKKPTIGTTLTPKAAKAAPKAPRPVPTKVAKKVEVVESAVKAPVKKTAVKAPAKKAAASSPAAKRDRAPVNSEELFSTFLTRFKLRSHLEGTVVGFTSHGAIIEVTMDGLPVQCYAPTTSLGDPAPARARDVLKRGSSHKFRFSSVDKDRRIAELSLVAP
jgi:Zc3h12a-like Ribonuclease NYN domain